MKVFMLGWEFPPYISGGVGAACHGLTQALLESGVDVVFMLPRPVAPHARPLVKVVQQQLPPVAPPPPLREALAHASKAAGNGSSHASAADDARRGQGGAPLVPQTAAFPYIPSRQQLERLSLRTVNAMLYPYLTPQQYHEIIVERQELEALGYTPPPDPLPAHAATPAAPPPPPVPPPSFGRPAAEPVASAPAPEPPAAALASQPQTVETEVPVVEPPPEYAPTLLEETHRYARIAVAVARKESFDVVHAHDWMTFEAAAAVARETHAPLIVQIHSTEYDRCPYGPDPLVIETERVGMQAADRVIAVSNRMRQMLVERYGIEAAKISVVYNAIDARDDAATPASHATFRPRGKSVLFLGRITSQKGPEHFLAAARKVLAIYPDARFVMAGEGDRRLAMEHLAATLGIGEKVMFTGLLSKPEIDSLFQAADVYVMPSVSEPFGIVSLEALRHDVPVIISRQSGVAELLHHVLKVDFWDTDELANKIVAILRHPPLANTMRQEGQNEVRQLTWHDAARQTMLIYDQLFAPAEAAGA